MIKINGSFGEGGGQIVRTAVALSSLIKIPVRIYNIRKGRPNPGLKNQHKHAIDLLKKITSAEVEGNYVGSLEITYKPKYIKGGSYFENIGTAGSITLLLQAVLLPTLFSKERTELEIVGGTDVKHSPSIDYFRFVILPYLKRFADVNLDIIKRGFYPKGGGKIIIKINPKIKRDDFETFEEFLNHLREKVNKIVIKKFSEIEKIEIHSVVTQDLEKRKVSERMIESCIENLNLDVKVKENIEYVRSLSTGAVITAVVYTKEGFVFGADALGERGKSSEEVGKELANKLIKYIELKTIDEHLSDNLIPYLALIKGEITVPEFTGHIVTNVWTCEHFFGKIFQIDKCVHKIKVI